MTHKQAVDMLAKKVDKQGAPSTAFPLGISSGYLQDILKGRREISPKLAKSMGLEIRRMYFKVKAAR